MEIDGPGQVTRTNTGRSVASTNLGKRKAMSTNDQAGTPLRRSKRTKISVAQKDVDLDW
jgi:hypothetical protein